MELLNIGFALLIMKIAVCVLPIAAGISLCMTSAERKQAMRSTLSSKLFGVSNAIPHLKFVRFIIVMGTALVLLGLAATWFLLLKRLLE